MMEEDYGCTNEMVEQDNGSFASQYTAAAARWGLAVYTMCPSLKPGKKRIVGAQWSDRTKIPSKSVLEFAKKRIGATTL